jgi:hypothetical protein
MVRAERHGIPNIFDISEGRAIRIRWITPVDDSHFTMVTVHRMAKSTPPLVKLRINGKLWSEMMEQERQDAPGDYEAQAGQGPVSLHSEEHLGSSDCGIIMQRRMLKAQIKVVAQDKALVTVLSGNFYKTHSPV